jgi:hypothetical protein
MIYSFLELFFALRLPAMAGKNSQTKCAHRVVRRTFLVRRVAMPGAKLQRASVELVLPSALVSLELLR